MVMEGKVLARFKSPRYLVISRLLEGRANWKNKCKEARREIKRYKNQVNDVGKSRESWRERAETSERELKVLRGEIDALKEELALREEESSQKAVGV
jgi:peptidoglycan hydrolase CwlO-like protein